MRFGYACINLSLEGSFTRCILAKVEEFGVPRVKQLALYNLRRTLDILKWNVKHNMYVYRATSELIPFASHDILADWEWWNDEDLLVWFSQISEYVKENNIRISIHPGQYNILNSPVPEVVRRTVADLTYQSRLIRMLGGSDMILHVGGAYGNKRESADRFKENFIKLDKSVSDHIRLENDDKTFTASDVLNICEDLGVKFMYDFHHDSCNPSIGKDEIKERLLRTWGDDRIKVHLSSGRRNNRDTAHADYINPDTWFAFNEIFDGWDIDVMLETKNKELSVFRLQALASS